MPVAVTHQEVIEVLSNEFGTKLMETILASAQWKAGLQAAEREIAEQGRELDSLRAEVADKSQLLSDAVAEREQLQRELDSLEAAQKT